MYVLYPWNTGVSEVISWKMKIKTLKKKSVSLIWCHCFILAVYCLTTSIFYLLPLWCCPITFPSHSPCLHLASISPSCLRQWKPNFTRFPSRLPWCEGKCSHFPCRRAGFSALRRSCYSECTTVEALGDSYSKKYVSNCHFYCSCDWTHGKRLLPSNINTHF